MHLEASWPFCGHPTTGRGQDTKSTPQLIYHAMLILLQLSIDIKEKTHEIIFTGVYSQ